MTGKIDLSEIRVLAMEFISGKKPAAYIQAELRGFAFRKKIPFNVVLDVFLSTLQKMLGGNDDGSKD